jgi:hypothetical protein
LFVERRQTNDTSRSSDENDDDDDDDERDDDVGSTQSAKGNKFNMVFSLHFMKLNTSICCYL